jgi:hypothetical protein
VRQLEGLVSKFGAKNRAVSSLEMAELDIRPLYVMMEIMVEKG